MLQVFVPGPLRNPMNGSHGHWSKHARWARQWRERTHLAVLEAGVSWAGLRENQEKRVTFLLHTHNRVDSDALGPMVKPCRDALIDVGLIRDDGPNSGNVFEYAQKIDRARRGVRITIEALT